MSDHHEPHYGNGKICYLELPSRDLNESAFFYQQIFDWKIRKNEDGSVSFDDGVNEVSGTWRLDRKAAEEVGLLIHIMVDNLEATIQNIVHLGGIIVRPAGLDAPEITAWFKDLTGNVLGLYQHRG